MRISAIDKIINKFVRINKDPIFIFGNQKSGTTAIAALLSIYGELSATLDIRGFSVLEQDMLHNGEMTLSQFISNHKKDFSKTIIKEPALTFLYEQVSNYFLMSKTIYVIRDPRDNIRSVLNRVKLRGDLSDLEDLTGIPEIWKRIIFNNWMGLDYSHYIGSLSARWNRAADVYLNNAPKMILVRYEDFLKDKVGIIEHLASELDIYKRSDINDKVDIQFQPRGNREISLKRFFGPENLAMIEKICGERMKEFGYVVS